MSSFASDINATYGAAFIGLLVSAILYGVTILQTFLYYRKYRRDSRNVKILVAILWLLDTLHLIFSTMAVYWYLVTSFDNPIALNRTIWSMNLQTDCNGLIGLMVEIFFARRVWIMSGNRIITGIIVLLACVHFGLGIVFTVDAFLLASYAQFPKLIWVACTGLGSAAAADLLIAFSMCWYLWRSRTGFHRTDSLISTLMIYSMNTGLVTGIIAFAAVVAFATMPTNLVWLSFFWVLGKCYVNSLLAALNSRESLRERAAVEDGSFLQLSPLAATRTIETAQYDPNWTPVRKPPTALTVTVETTTVYKTDYLDSPLRSDGSSSYMGREPMSFSSIIADDKL